VPIQWTQRTWRQFLAIIDAVLEDNPSAVERVYDAIMDSVSRLVTFPEMGRRERVPETRELVIAAQPYIVAYRIRGQTIHSLAVLHGGRGYRPRHGAGSRVLV
jgi:plasmid stabilization system protein ParE